MDKIFSLKQYEIADNPPMRFHVFNLYLYLPYIILSNLYAIFTTFNALVILLDIAGTFLAISAMIGFNKKKYYGWKAIMLLHSIYIITGIILCMLPPQYEGWASVMISNCIISLLIMFYYYKRQIIFMNNDIKSSKKEISPINTSHLNNNIITHSTIQTNVLIQPTFCRKCGNKLSSDSEFCQYCGTKIIKE